VVKLPPGAKLDTAPPNTRKDTKYGSYSVQVEQQPGQVVVRSHLSINVSRVKPQAYAAWKKFCADADQAFSPRLWITP
jgi:hypothetical protein